MLLIIDLKDFYEMLVTWETKTLKLVYNTISKREIPILDVNGEMLNP